MGATENQNALVHWATGFHFFPALLFTTKTRTFHSYLHPGPEWRIFYILTGLMTSFKAIFTNVCANCQFATRENYTAVQRHELQFVLLKQYFTLPLRSFLKYCFYHSKIKSLSSRRRVTSSIYSVGACVYFTVKGLQEDKLYNVELEPLNKANFISFV